jgi:hypothetical protein
MRIFTKSRGLEEILGIGFILAQTFDLIKILWGIYDELAA